MPKAFITKKLSDHIYFLKLFYFRHLFNRRKKLQQNAKNGHFTEVTKPFGRFSRYKKVLYSVTAWTSRALPFFTEER